MYQAKQIYDKLAVGRRIRGRRKELGISRQELASQIGKTEKYYADIERGYCGMSLDTMIDIAGCLGTVSYTHLDVYKRQTFWWMGLLWKNSGI